MGRTALGEETGLRRTPSEAERLAAPIVVTGVDGSGLSIVADLLTTVACIWGRGSVPMARRNRRHSRRRWI